jgi:hypothetical protein
MNYSSTIAFDIFIFELKKLPHKKLLTNMMSFAYRVL